MNYVAGWIICDDTEYAINFNSVNARSGSISELVAQQQESSASRLKAVMK